MFYGAACTFKTNSSKEESLTTKLTQDQRVLLFWGILVQLFPAYEDFFFIILLKSFSI